MYSFPCFFAPFPFSSAFACVTIITLNIRPQMLSTFFIDLLLLITHLLSFRGAEVLWPSKWWLTEDSWHKNTKKGKKSMNSTASIFISGHHRALFLSCLDEYSWPHLPALHGKRQRAETHGQIFTYRHTPLNYKIPLSAAPSCFYLTHNYTHSHTLSADLVSIQGQ